VLARFWKATVRVRVSASATRLFFKVKVNFGKSHTGQPGKFRPMYLLLACNDTVPISVWRGGGLRCTECRIVTVVVDASGKNS